ncbi:hypothetical protein ElyMa_004215500 [Elysia marginata]|uniref:BHLH domain-containing protein n=1 Tax=Elysia marginata TaxID=1093978 RepID=A0AAV4GQF0_9GAST|nr:hypothetical protein ElyMa_004215500 [Elysia marginata]
MNQTHSAQEYLLTTFAAPMEHDERSGDASSDKPIDIVALPEDRPGTSGLPARTTSEVAGVSSAFQVETSGVSERPVSSRAIIRRRRKRARTEGMTREETNTAERNRMNRIREALNGLRDELPDKFKNRTHRRANIQKKFVVAYTVDYLNELGVFVRGVRQSLCRDSPDLQNAANEKCLDAGETGLSAGYPGPV